MEHGAWALGNKLCSIMVKQEQSPELPVDPLAASSTMAAAAAMATPPLLGLSPISRLPIPHQVSLGSIHRERGREAEGRERGVTPNVLDCTPGSMNWEPWELRVFGLPH